jgi:hypothetical protein
MRLVKSPESRKSCCRSNKEYIVSLNLAAPLAVTDSELEWLEREMGPFIAELLITSG